MEKIKIRIKDLVDIFNIQGISDKKREKVLAKYNIDSKKFKKIKTRLNSGRWWIADKE